MKERMQPLIVRTALVAIVLAWIGLVWHGAEKKPAAAAEKEQAKGKTPQAWTLEEAMTQLKLHPNDPYLQYVALQLARRENRLDDTANEVERLIWRNDRGRNNERVEQVDLFSIFSGALAVQESLQLDAMRGERPRRGPRAVPRDPEKPPLPPGEKEPDKPRTETVAVADLKGPGVKSHPWDKMLGDKKPEVGNLARCVPEDFYLIEFRSLTKMLEVLDAGDLLSKYVFNTATRDARTQQTGEHLKQQLVMETNPLLKPVYDLVVEEVAVTGSDLYLAEGSDVTLLFRYRQPEVFKARMDGFLTSAEKKHPTAKRSTGECLGVPYVHLVTPDRTLCVYSAYPGENLHVRTNSKVALERVLEAIKGKRADGQVVQRLGDSNEFRYIRTLMPRGAKEEDGFVYLSDPFIRRLVGPQVKLTERRRIICYNHLRMIGHGGLMYRTEYGQAATSLEELEKAACTPGTFGKGIYACPDGGKYSLTAEGTHGVCSHHGHARFLTPCCEAPVGKVTGDEADEYRAFVEDYNQYWRTFFDPIAIRLQVTPQQYRLETIVLPLIDNSIYTSMAMALGGKPEPLDGLPVPKKNIFTVAGRFNKEALLREAGLDDKPDEKDPSAEIKSSARTLREIGLAMHNHHGAHGHLPQAANLDKQGKPLLSWRVHLLPYFEQDKLYAEFRLNEPWDSEHNKKLIARMPAVFRGPNKKLGDEGKTTFLVPVGEVTLFPGGEKKMNFAKVIDGTSNTIMAVDAKEDQAVIWTKPDDWKYDPKQVLKMLKGRHGDGFVVLFADGSVRFLRDTINEETLRALFTAAGGEEVTVRPADEKQLEPDRDRFDIPGLPREKWEELKVEEVLKKGIGNQVGLHVYDSVPNFDFNLPQFLGLMSGTFNGRRGFNFLGGEEIMVSFLIASLNAPVYVSIPVQDAKIVDRFLDQLDELLAAQARQLKEQGLFGVSFDFYKVQLRPDKDMRVGTVQFGPVKWRMFWARVGGGLYVASKKFILDDLLEADAVRTKEAAEGKTFDTGPTAHGMIRLRARNWNQVLADYRLGWAENSREACLNNQGLLSSVGRAIVARPPGSGITGPGATDPDRGDQMHKQADRLHGTHFYCPEGGRYLLTEDGKKCSCSVHGSALNPRQPAEPGAKGSTGKLLQDMTGITATLHFLEDGLHAVMVIERK